MSYRHKYTVKKQLTKDEVNKKLKGVCAGVAKYYQVPRVVIRAAAVVALVMFPLATGVAYLLATLLLPSGSRY